MKSTCNRVSIAAGLGLVLALGACDRATVREDVKELEHTKDEVAAEVKEQLKSVKVGAERLKEELPSREQVREQVAETARDVEEVAHDVKDVAKAAGAKVKEGAREVREELREGTAKE